jgi:hypothetical protein
MRLAGRDWSAIEWNDRSQGPLGGSRVSGKDRSGFLKSAMTMKPDLKGGIQISAPASDSVLPEDVVPVLKFLSLLKADDHLRHIAAGYEVPDAAIVDRQGRRSASTSRSGRAGTSPDVGSRFSSPSAGG